MSLVLACMMLMVSLSTGCEKNAESADATTTETTSDAANVTTTDGTTIDISKPVVLNGYLLGAAPEGMEEVVAQLNEKLKKDINATVNINYISWGDFASKYPLILAAGEDVDFIFTANWSFYSQEAGKGAFREITKEDMEKYMPLHTANVNPAAFDQAKVDGKVYMITTSTPDKKIPLAVIRGDLRKKYNVPEITKFSEIEPYLEAIKSNESDMFPIYCDGSYDITQAFNALISEKSDNRQDVLSSTGSGSEVKWNLESETVKLEISLENAQYLELSKQVATTMKAWSAKGYLNQDAFANTVRSKDSFVQGKSAVGFGNSIDMQSVIAASAANGWEIELIPLLDQQGHYAADPFINNGVAIAASSENPERAMMALDLIMEDPEYNTLVYFGIEGKNYIIKDGKMDMPDGVTAETNTYAPDAAGFWFTNKDQFLPLASWTPEYAQLREDLKTKDILVNHPMTAFAPNTNNVQTEVATLNQVIVQYSQPIYMGMVDNVDEAYDTLIKKLKDAGIEKVRDELQTQVDAYMANF